MASCARVPHSVIHEHVGFQIASTVGHEEDVGSFRNVMPQDRGILHGDPCDECIVLARRSTSSTTASRYGTCALMSSWYVGARLSCTACGIAACSSARNRSCEALLSVRNLTPHATVVAVVSCPAIIKPKNSSAMARLWYAVRRRPALFCCHVLLP